MAHLKGIAGFNKSDLKKTDTLITTKSGDQILEKRDDDGHVTTELVGKVVFEDRDLGKIIPGLVLGSAHVADDLEQLTDNKVTHVINAATGVPNYFPDKFKYLRFDVNDIADTVITGTFEQSFPFIDEAIENGGCAFVHCNQGISRSASIVIGYLMSRKGMSYQTAFDHVKAKRSIICPNYGFRAQLEAYKPDDQEK